jgi:hypothetical protein
VELWDLAETESTLYSAGTHFYQKTLSSSFKPSENYTRKNV